MRLAIHPDTVLATVTCSNCSTSFQTRSTRPSLEVEICSGCHPAYTGAQRAGTGGSRIERFERRRAAGARARRAQTPPGA
jgi:large subunit ribosomal protein L31